MVTTIFLEMREYKILDMDFFILNTTQKEENRILNRK